MNDADLRLVVAALQGAKAAAERLRGQSGSQEAVQLVTELGNLLMMVTMTFRRDEDAGTTSNSPKHAKHRRGRHNRKRTDR